MRAFAVAFAAAVAMGACAPSPPPPPPPLDPTGTFAVSIDAQGQQVGGTLVIRGERGAYTGSIDTDMGGASIADVVVDGDRVTFSLPEVGVFFQVVFEGDGFTGTFDGAMGAGNIVGTRRPDR